MNTCLTQTHTNDNLTTCTEDRSSFCSELYLIQEEKTVTSWVSEKEVDEHFEKENNRGYVWRANMCTPHVDVLWWRTTRTIYFGLNANFLYTSVCAGDFRLIVPMYCMRVCVRMIRNLFFFRFRPTFTKDTIHFIDANLISAQNRLPEKRLSMHQHFVRSAIPFDFVVAVYLVYQRLCLILRSMRIQILRIRAHIIHCSLPFSLFRTVLHLSTSSLCFKINSKPIRPISFANTYCGQPLRHPWLPLSPSHTQFIF